MSISHPQEEVYHIIEGELELAIAGFTQRLGPGFVGVVPSNTLHAVKAISSGKVIVVDYPLRDLPCINQPYARAEAPQPFRNIELAIGEGPCRTSLPLTLLGRS